MTDIAKTYLTFSDVIDHLADYAQGNGQSVQKTVLTRCALRAYDEVVHGHEWPFLRSIARIHVHAAQSKGTVSYVHSTRTLTISDSTWPTWATKEYGASVYLDGVVCDIDARVSDTDVTLDADMNPGEDVSDADYTLFCYWYPLPNDFLTTIGPMAENFRQFGTQSTLEEIAEYHRFSPLSGDMRLWAIGANPNGGLALHVWPALDSAVRLDLPYKRRPRDLRHTGYAAGDFAGTVSISGTTVTGVTTSFTSTMAGAVLRVGTTRPPDGLEGQFPYVQELVIKSVSSATAATLETAGTTVSSKSYRISDPVSLERVAWDALLTAAEKHLARMRNFKGYVMTVENHRHAMQIAKAAAAPTISGRVMRGGERTTFKNYNRLADLT